MSESAQECGIAVEGPDRNRETSGETGGEHTRRRFLGALGSGITMAVAASGTAGARETPTVSMGDTYFDPIGLAVEPGTTVRFEIEAGSHSATAYEDRIPSEAHAFDSGTISNGGFEYTFETPGTYDYYCLPHQSMGMTGRVVVGQPGGPAEKTPIPHGAVPASDDIVEQESIGIDQFDGSGGDSVRMKGDGSGGNDHGGMMDSGSGMMGGKDHGWRMLVPAGLFTTVLGLAGGAIYWGSRQQDRESDRDDDARTPTEREDVTAVVIDDDAIATLEEEYARGAIAEDEFRRRFDRLKGDE